MAITSPGIGSGLDVNSIVSQLIKAEGERPSTRLDIREAEYQVRLSGYAFIKSTVSELQTSLGALNNPSTYTGTSISSSDSDVLTATSSGSASAASYSVNVTALADSQKLSTDPALTAAQFTSSTDVLGTGTLTFKFGTTTYDKGTDNYSGFVANPDKATATVSITDGSLEGIRDAINTAKIGATASIINDGTYFRLVISSDSSGAKNSIQISADDNDLNDDDASGLSLLSFNATSNNIEQTVAGTDAQLDINGINITSESNAVANNIDNVTLNLKTIGSSTVSVSRDDDKINKGVQGFVAAFNQLQVTVKDLTGYNAATQVAGTLNGDTIVRTIDSTIKRMLGTPIGTVGDGFSILADIGITTDVKTGQLVIDQDKLDASIASSPDKITSLFSAYGAPSDTLVQFDSATDSTTRGNYAVNISQLATNGTFAGSVAANLTITSNVNDSLDVDIDGIAATVKLTAGTYTASSLVAEVQSQINNTTAIKNAKVSVKVTESAGVLSITSNSYGSVSKVNIIGGNGSTGLVGTTSTIVDGLDVAGTIGGATAVGSGQYLTGAGSGSKGLKLLVTGTLTGSRGSVDFNRGYADTLSDYLGQILDDKTGILSSTTSTLESNIKDVVTDREDLAARLEDIEVRIRRRFTALDTLISTLQNTSTFLVQQLDSLPTIGGNNKR